MINHNAHNKNDTWLTPPELLTALGPFDLDPCVPPGMPWSTAARHYVHGTHDGLIEPWEGFVWCNPPYSAPLPWITRMAAHGNGLLLLPAKSPETRWGQTLLTSADAVLFMRGRLLFHYIDGRKSMGKWSPHLLAAYGQEAVDRLRQLSHSSDFGGILMGKV